MSCLCNLYNLNKSNKSNLILNIFNKFCTWTCQKDILKLKMKIDVKDLSLLLSFLCDFEEQTSYTLISTRIDK